jgi:hypothetical protein
VIVDAPTRRSRRTYVRSTARTSAAGFTPGCRKKKRSSCRSVASIIACGMSASGVHVR